MVSIVIGLISTIEMSRLLGNAASSILSTTKQGGITSGMD